MMYRVGIIGCGGIAQVHAQVLSSMQEVSLAACADIRPERAQALAEKHGMRAYSSLEEMLEHEQLDVVHICTPHYLHAPMAQQLAQKGIAVFSEKPPAINREQWAQFRAAADSVSVGICFQNRYNPNVVELKRILAERPYGELHGARAFVTWHRTVPYYLDSGWRGTWATEGGGALINQSIHTLDLLIWLLGAPDEVRGTMSNRHLKDVIEVEDTVEAWMRIGGCSALFYATTAYSTDAPVLMDFHFDQAVVRLENERLEIHRNGEIERREYPMEAKLGKGYWGNGHRACIHDFYSALAEGRPYQNDPASVDATVDTMLTLYENCRDMI